MENPICLNPVFTTSGDFGQFSVLRRAATPTIQGFGLAAVMKNFSPDLAMTSLRRSPSRDAARIARQLSAYFRQRGDAAGTGHRRAACGSKPNPVRFRSAICVVVESDKYVTFWIFSFSELFCAWPRYKIAIFINNPNQIFAIDFL